VLLQKADAKQDKGDCPDGTCMSRTDYDRLAEQPEGREVSALPTPKKLNTWCSGFTGWHWLCRMQAEEDRFTAPKSATGFRNSK
jgi:hypothetical protein